MILWYNILVKGGNLSAFLYLLMHAEDSERGTNVKIFAGGFEI
jgi:hypothetical protein